MTMKLPIDHEQTQPAKMVLDPAKRYRFTWPGQPSRVVSGDELAAICRGADESMLDIAEETARSPEIMPPAFSSRPGLQGDK